MSQRNNTARKSVDASRRPICDNCGSPFSPLRRHQKFCHPDCKKAYHKKAYRIGEAKMQSRGMHFARLDNSPRLQRVLAFLQDGRPHTTREIIRGADVCAVNAIVAELRLNGYDIDCRCLGRRDNSMVYEYRLKQREAV